MTGKVTPRLNAVELQAERVTPRLNAVELQAERAKELTVLAGVLSVDALRARRAFGRRTRDELSARRDDNSLVRGFLRDFSFLFLLRGHCESAYQLYKNVCTFPRKKRFCCNVLQKSLKEEQRSVFHVFKFPSFRFRRKEALSSFRSNGKGPGLFSPREHSALFSELFVRAHAR